MDLNKVEIDQELANQGAACEYEDAVFYVRADSWPAYQNAVNRAVNDLRRKAGPGRDINMHQFREMIQPRLVVRYLLTGWSNIFVDGNELEFESERAEKLLLPRFKNVVHHLRDFAERESNYYRQEVEESAGKLKLASNS